MSQVLSLVLCINYILSFSSHKPLSKVGKSIPWEIQWVFGIARIPAQACLTLSSGVLSPPWAASLLTHPTAYGNVTFALQIFFFYIDIYHLPCSPVSHLKKKKKNLPWIHTQIGVLMSCGLSASPSSPASLIQPAVSPPSPSQPQVLAEPAL